MSNYVFLCQDCNKEFAKTLHMADVEKAVIERPIAEANEFFRPSPRSQPSLQKRAE